MQNPEGQLGNSFVETLSSPCVTDSILLDQISFPFSTMSSSSSISSSEQTEFEEVLIIENLRARTMVVGSSEPRIIDEFGPEVQTAGLRLTGT